MVNIRNQDKNRQQMQKPMIAQRICFAVVFCLIFYSVWLLWDHLTPGLDDDVTDYTVVDDEQFMDSDFTEVTPTTRSRTTPSSPTTTPGRTLYIITPTYPRGEQVAELTRLGQTLKLVPDLVWLVVEDAMNKTKAVEKLLMRLNIPYVHLIAPIPEEFLGKPISERPRGVSNRIRALEWLRANATSGVFYFADDDNSYDIRIFEEMRGTRRVSMWPVGLLSLGVTSPIVRGGEVVGFYEGWIGNRKFAVDMAEFAVSVEFLLQRPNATMPYLVGWEEERFLISLAPLELKDIEPKASNCTEVMVWHTQTKSPPPLKPLDLKLYADTNLVQLHNNL